MTNIPGRFWHALKALFAFSLYMSTNNFLCLLWSVEALPFGQGERWECKLGQQKDTSSFRVFFIGMYHIYKREISSHFFLIFNNTELGL
jgi:hypothetical protein